MIKAKTIRKQRIYNGRVIDLDRFLVRLPGGKMTTLEIIDHPGAAAVVPIANDGRIILIRQYRHAAGGYLYEIPAGTLNEGEKPLNCAKRELVEETGYRAGRWKKLRTIFTTPGFTNEKIHIYLASNLAPAKTKHDFDEVIEVCMFKKEAVMEMIKGRRIVDSKTIIGLYSAFAQE